MMDIPTGGMTFSH